MKRFFRHSWIFLVLGALLFAGCKESKVPPPPLEEVKLLDRLYSAMRAGRNEEAIAIIDKLDALSPDDMTLAEMRLRLISNACVKSVQSALDRNDPEGALKLTEVAIKKYPTIPRLKAMAEELQSLLQLQQAADKLAAAQSASELAIALTEIEPLAAAHPEAKTLAAEIKRRQADLNKLRAEEATRAKQYIDPLDPINKKKK